MDIHQTTKRKFLLSNALFKQKNRQNLIKTMIFIIVISLIVMMISQPNLCITSIYNGLVIWATTVLPSLFPFIFLTKILSGLNVLENLSRFFSKITKFLFKAPAISGYIFLMSIISGYPIGAKLISEFYNQGKLTAKQANKLVTFCSTSGPIFIIGSVGTAMFLNKKIGYILFFSHLISTILNGILYRNKFVDKTQNQTNLTQNDDLTQLLPNSMNDTILSCLVVGGYIALFFMITSLLANLSIFNKFTAIIGHLLSPFGATEPAIKSTFFGIFEISKGCFEIAKSGISTLASATIASFLISFGGICTFFQATTFLIKCKVNLKFYILQKLTHGILSAIVTIILFNVFP